MSRRTTLAIVAGGLVAVLAGGGFLYMLFADTATPVDVDEAVDRYRDTEQPTAVPSTTTTPETTARPAEGVYVYVTEGESGVDVLGGTTHTYPEESTVTIRHTDCGLLQRWAPLDERWEEEELCLTDAGRTRSSVFVHHEFFGIAEDRVMRCAPGYVVFPTDPQVGDTWATSCRSANTEVGGTAEVVAFETRLVGDESIETVHVRIEEHADGGDEGPGRHDYWLRTSDGLLIERSSSVETRSDTPVGTATFTERYTIRLTSSTPRT